MPSKLSLRGEFLVSIGLRHVVLLGMWRWREGDGEERREIYIAILEDEVQVEVNV